MADIDVRISVQNVDDPTKRYEGLIRISKEMLSDGIAKPNELIALVVEKVSDGMCQMLRKEPEDKLKEKLL